MKEVVRSYSIHILLGRPRWPLLTLIGHTAKVPTVYFCPRRSLAALLTGAERRVLPSEPLHLLWELCTLAERREGKVLTLIPLTPETREFVRQNEAALAEKYIIKDTV